MSIRQILPNARSASYTTPANKNSTTNANESVAQQALYIRKLANDVDVLLVSPRVKELLSQVIAEVYEDGVPVILVDRGIDGDQFTSFLRASNKMIGQHRQSAISLINQSAERIKDRLWQTERDLFNEGQWLLRRERLQTTLALVNDFQRVESYQPFVFDPEKQQAAEPLA